jgi:glycogen operon protein
MILGGDEIGRTQQGNNNAYCQDNEISWFHWNAADAELLEFTSRLIELRRRHHVLRRRRFVTGAMVGDIGWFTPAGSSMTESNWRAGWTRSVVAYLDGVRDADRDERGRAMLDDDLLVVINGWWEPLTFTLPDVGSPRAWQYELDTFSGLFGPEAGTGGQAGATITVGPRSVVLLRAEPAAARPAAP